MSLEKINIHSKQKGLKEKKVIGLIKQQEVDKLFKIHNLPSFSTTQLKKNKELLKNNLFQFFIKLVDDWNSKVQNNKQPVNFRSELFKIDFIYSSLKIIGDRNPNFIKKLQKLYKWYRQNSPGQAFTIKASNKTATIDEDWEIRKRFKYNAQNQLKNYKRKILDMNLLTVFNHSMFQNHDKLKNKLKIKSNVNFQQLKLEQDKVKKTTNKQDIKNQGNLRQIQKSVTCHYVNFAQYKQSHQLLRKRRQIREITNIQQNWKKQHSRYQKHLSINFYKGFQQKNIKFKTTKNIRRANSSEQINRILAKDLKIKVNEIQKSQNCTMLQSIDGINLLSNPFKATPRSKKKK